MSNRIRQSIAAPAILASLVALASAACYSDPPLELIHDFTPPGDGIRYELLSLGFGHSAAKPGSPFFLARPSRQERTARWQFWLLRGGGRIIIINPGFVDPALAKEVGLKDRLTHKALLAQVGLTPRDVTDVILTRMNRYRDDACSLFPKARFHVQGVNYARAQMWVVYKKQKEYRIGPKTLKFLDKVDADGRLMLLDGPVEIFEGLKTNVARAYRRRALVYLTVQTGDGKYVIPGDLVPYFNFLDRKLKTARSNRDLHQVFVRMAGDRERVLPSFDPALAKRFEKVTANVVRIAGRDKHEEQTSASKERR